MSSLPRGRMLRGEALLCFWVTSQVTWPLLPTAANPRRATSPGGTRSSVSWTNAPAPGHDRDRNFAWPCSSPCSSPPPHPPPPRPGNLGANGSVAKLRVVEFRARDPPLFVAAANGRIRNIGGCPGDSVICHRITFENGTWNEGPPAAAAAAAAPAPGPGPAAAAAAASASSAAAPAAWSCAAAMRPSARR